MRQQRFDTEKFAKAIKTKRVIELNIGLREAGKKIKVSTATVSRMENEYTAEIDNIIKACNWLGVSVCEFITKTKNN